MDRDMSDEHMHARNGGGQEQILRQLENKRRQLDYEIEEFKKQKEAEYKKFERRLRKEHARNTQGDLNGQTQEDGDPQSQSDAKLREPRSSDTCGRKRPKSHPEASNPESTNQAGSPAFGGSPGPPKENRHRGREWEGVFTPSYLSLIDGERDTPSHAHSTNSPTIHLSSSASPHRHRNFLPILSPTTPQPLSSSAPPHSPTLSVHPHHQRSDSSNSIASVSSLRSSMKDPKTPKSPKRVLFSIEDGKVVSPSSSPTVSRKSGDGGEGGRLESEAVEGVMDLGKRSARGGKKKTRRKERGPRDEGERGRERVTEEGDVAEEKEKGKVTEGKEGRKDAGEVAMDSWTKSVPDRLGDESAANGVEGPLTQTSPPKDFADVGGDGDDLFTFDEHMDTVDKGKGKPVDEAGAAFEIDDEDESAGGEPIATGNSPHAGSLPIEIRWPQRRQSGGSNG